ncbi:unnamed protein product, partial [Amoebophrya sp. A25]
KVAGFNFNTRQSPASNRADETGGVPLGILLESHTAVPAPGTAVIGTSAPVKTLTTTPPLSGSLVPNFFDCVGHGWKRHVMVEKLSVLVQTFDSITRHYHCVLQKTFAVARLGIFLEDDLGIAKDIFHYFRGIETLIEKYEETAVWCASGWNDNGMKKNVHDPRRLFRTDFFPGLGWMTSRRIAE